MAIEFIDRVSAKPGMVRIVPENGDPPFLARIERADEPSVAGTPINATSLNLAQETLVYQDANGAHTFKRVYVATNGNDNNTGATTSTPMATIKAAIRKYAKWHKYIDIYLLDGTYTENIGTISTDSCSLSIRSNSEDKEKVTINMDGMLESHIQLLRLYNLTLNLTASGVRALSVNAGMLYAYNVRVNMPTSSSNPLLNVYNGASVFLSECVLNAGTGAAVYGNQALHIKAYNCTSERKLTRGFYANNGSNIEYTPTLNATQMVYEANGGKCYLSNTSGAEVGSLYGQHKGADGLLIQWGVATITPSATDVPTSVVVTYPFPYAENPITVATAVSSVPEKISVSVQRSGDLVPDSKKQFAMTLTRNGVTATGINWIAIGKGVN